MQAIVGLLLSLCVFVAATEPHQWGEQAMAAGAVMMAEGVDRFQDGVAMKEKHSRKFDVFGVPVGGEIGYKVGAGDSLNRDKREAEELESEGGDDTIKVQFEIPEETFFSDPSSEADQGEPGNKDKKWHKRFWEACVRFMHRMGQYFSRATNE